jgi:PAS domain S-box-containing protein
MYFTISEEGVVLSVNQFGASSLGYEQDELVNNSVWEIVHPDDLLAVKQQIKHIFTQGKEYEEIEFRKLRKDGAICWVHERISLITRKNGARELRIACRDVTDQKRVEEESRERQAQLAHLARVNTMGEMASGLAHELNQPLTAISTYASACLRMLQPGSKNPEKLAYGLEQTAIQARRAGEIIRRLREFIRKDTYQRTIVDVNALVTEVIGLTEPETRGKGVRLELDLNNHLPPVQGTAIQIEQVILNLVRNGIDSINLAGNEEGTIVVGTSIDNQGSVLVSVKDNGQGLDKKHAKQIFEPFHTTKSDGMGMGLSISRSIIEAHEGRLWFDANDGAGTTFYFTIPAEQGVNVA